MNREDARSNLRVLDQITGCLVGGALGDALGAQFENMTAKRATATFERGEWRTGPLRITSNTQLTLFTAEGMVRASQRFREKGLCSIPCVLKLAYRRWLHTQGDTEPHFFDRGWLMECPELQVVRGTSATLKAALKNGAKKSSAGNGAITRLAPVALTTLNDVPELAADIAAISHPHPDARQAASQLATILQHVLRGEGLEGAIRLGPWSHEYHWAACCEIPPGPTLTAQQALRWTVHSIAKGHYPAPFDFWRSLRHAVCSGGASDAVGSLTGQLLGCYLGYSALPSEMVSRLELLCELRMVARELWIEYYSGWSQLYPPN